MRAPSTSPAPAWPTKHANARSIVSTLPAIVRSSRRATSSTVIVRPPSRAVEPQGRPEPAVPSVIAITREGDLAAIATRIAAGWT